MLYVDDLVITGPDLPEMSRVKTQLSGGLDMKDLGDLHYFLWIEVIYTPNGILLTQRHYVLNMLYKFGMMYCQSVSTPLHQNLKLCHDSGEAYNEKRFRQTVGSIIYLTIRRPDLSYPIIMISQFM